MAGKQSLIILITLALCITSVKANQCKTFAGFDFLNYNELGKLVDKENEIPDAINKKYQILLNTVFCNSDHSNPDNQIKLKQHPKIKEDYFRISHWNIERGMNLDAIIALLKRPEHYFQYMAKEKIKNEDELDDEIKMLQDTDILSLNEVDLGMPRTGYRSVVQELAKALKANYAFVPEFIELDPEFLKAPQINKTKFRGIHGNAIISKYPIEKVSVIRLCDCYDWFGEEKEKLSFLEKARRSSSKLVIEEKIETELRKGSRVALIADIRLPNNQIITVVNVHLENRTQPECRVKQISEILARVKKQSNPVILAGDMNIELENLGAPPEFFPE